MACIIYNMFTHKSDMAWDFNHLFENEGLLNFEACHVQYTVNVVISKTVPDRFVVTISTDH